MRMFKRNRYKLVEEQRAMTISFDDFMKLDVRVGVVVAVQPFERARKPTYKVQVDFGDEIGLKWSSVQAKSTYTEAEMMGRQVVAVVNFAPKNIAGFMSEALILGVPDADGQLVLLAPDRPAKIGGRIY